MQPRSKASSKAVAGAPKLDEMPRREAGAAKGGFFGIDHIQSSMRNPGIDIQIQIHFNIAKSPIRVLH